MSLNYGYVGSTEVSKRILCQIDIDPEIVISFSDAHRDRISGFTTYPEYDDRWTQVESINDDRTQRRLREADLDILFVMGWQELLNTETLGIPSTGCVGRHLSLLPKRRGRAPVAWALIHGLDKTGVTLFWLDEGVDTGDIIDQQSAPIASDDEAHDLHDKLTTATIDLLEDTIPTFESGTFPREPQNHSEATYTHPRRPDMGLIDWEKSAPRLHDFIRAQTHPYPGAFTYHKMDKVTIWHASVDHPTTTRGRPGQVLSRIGENELHVQTGSGTLRVEIEHHDQNYPITEGNVLGSLP